MPSSMALPTILAIGKPATKTRKSARFYPMTTMGKIPKFLSKTHGENPAKTHAVATKLHHQDVTHESTCIANLHDAARAAHQEHVSWSDASDWKGSASVGRCPCGCCWWYGCFSNCCATVGAMTLVTLVFLLDCCCCCWCFKSGRNIAFGGRSRILRLVSG